MTSLDLTPPVNCLYGAPMGRNWATGFAGVRGSSGDFDPAQPLHLNYVPLDNGGYDKGGAYWGHGPRIYVIYDDLGEFMHSMRAKGRNAAKNEFRQDWPDAWFYGEKKPR